MSERTTNDIDAVDVYWRPGCPYCSALLGALERAGVVLRLHNIWQDDDARAFVRSVNNGNETVPTVVLGDVVVTNPPPTVVLDTLRVHHAHLISTAP